MKICNICCKTGVLFWCKTPDFFELHCSTEAKIHLLSCDDVIASLVAKVNSFTEHCGSLKHATKGSVMGNTASEQKT